MFHAKTPLPERRPQDLDILHSLASAHLLFGQYGKAISLLRLALWLDPDSAKTLELMAHASLRAGDPDTAVRAVKHLESIGAVVPKELQVRRRLAIIARQGDDPAARDV
jgi:Flp pilus assembly protein TadD